MTSPILLNRAAVMPEGPGAQPASPALPDAPPINVFLQILVAQLQNQNPLEPQKGTEFITQLAQFNVLEQLIAIRAELKALRQQESAAGLGPAA